MAKPTRFITTLCFLALLMSLMQPGTARSDVEARYPTQTQLRDLLAAHPELVLDVLREHPLELVQILEQGLLAKRELERQRQEQEDLAMDRNPEISKDRPIRGNPVAPITIVEYSDFLCPYCSQATATVKRLLDLDDDGELRLIFKHLPLNPVSRELALAYEAAAMQSHEAAWQLHDLLFERQAELRGNAEAVLESIVARLDIDLDRFAADRASPEAAGRILKDMEEARSFGFSGTPMFLINGIPVRGAVPLQEFQRVVEMAGTKSNGAPAGE
ncbi:DsbA family protein [Desulfonatronum parangueonense]